jgi:cystathionine beta-lyase/cystathionine gamma-synthase
MTTIGQQMPFLWSETVGTLCRAVIGSITMPKRFASCCCLIQKVFGISSIFAIQLTQTVKRVYYPKHNPTKGLFDRCRNEDGGYGGLLSATFYTKADAVNFFDSLRTAKGPSLGTNFTLRYSDTLPA